MSQMLNELKINEVSLVDAPANASICPITGKRRRHAVISLFKRDTSDDPPTRVFKYQSKTKENQSTMQQFEQVLKSATTRNQIADAIEAEARAVAKRDNISEGQAYIRVMEQHPAAYAAYESAAKQTATWNVQKREERVTSAEIILDAKALRLQKLSPGMNFAQAISAVLKAEPEIYTRYETELRQGRTVVAKTADPEAVGYEQPEDDDEENDEGEDCLTCGGAGRVKDGKGKDGQCPVCGGTGIEPSDDDGDEDQAAKIALLQKKVAKLEARLTR